MSLSGDAAPRLIPTTDPTARLERIRRFGDRPAYLWREGVRWRSRTYAEIYRRTLACAARLSGAGMVAGTPALIQGPPHPDWVEALLGTFLAGGVAVPLDEGTPEEFRIEVARRSESRFLIAPPGITLPPGCRRLEMGIWGNDSPPTDSPPAPSFDTGRRAEIVFTSGTTGEPRGVVLTHGNLASDFAPIERAFLRRESLVRRFGELRFLSTLPLSHMFGQAMNVFLPLFMGLTVAFVPARPRDLFEAARRIRPWGLFTVPRLMDLLASELRRLLREEGGLERTERAQDRFSGWPFYLQSLRFAGVQSRLGLRFRLFVVGGAALPQTVQRYWESLGYLLVQGYGLTETAPIVSISNPFERRPGSVGRPLSIQEIRLGPGGEVLVRGPNVTEGYFQSSESAGSDGWFHTGDLGELDDHGRLRIRGRLKDVIVTAEGENVYPPDVEAALLRTGMVREACVLGLPLEGGERVHAVLIMEQGGNPEASVAAANRSLQPKQRIRDYTVWEEKEDLPRTPTGKIRKGILRERILARRLERGESGSASPATSGIRRRIAGLARISPDRLEPRTRLVEELGFGSLDLVELAVAIEEEFGIVLSEESLGSATVGDLEQAVLEAASGRTTPPAPASTGAGAPPGGPDEEQIPPPPPAPPEPSLRPGFLRMPRWTRGFAAWAFRRFVEEIFYRPLIRFYARPEVVGLQNLERASPPYLFVANHRSYLDTGLFKTLLPRPLRGRIAPAMTTRYHRVFFGELPGGRARYLKEWFQVRLTELLFGTWPLPETAGFRSSLAYAGELADDGESILIFPEGRHVPEGVIQPFRGGIGIFARELRAPVIPAWVEGSAQVLPDKKRWLRFGRTKLILGAPLLIDPEADPAETTRRIESAVRELGRPA